jgi:Protein of unknown function (DUF1759)
LTNLHQRVTVKTNPLRASETRTTGSSPQVVASTSGPTQDQTQGTSNPTGVPAQAGLAPTERQELADLQNAVRQLSRQMTAFISRGQTRQQSNPPNPPPAGSGNPQGSRRGDRPTGPSDSSDSDPGYPGHRSLRGQGARPLPQRVQYTRKQPSLTVKPFKGEKRDYLRFRTAFKDTYEGVGLSKVLLAIHLGEHLQGDAGAKFGNMANTPTRHTYRAMWASLDANYGTERELTMDKLDRFNQMPAIKTFTPATIGMLFSLFNDIWPALVADLGDRIYDEGHLTFHTFLKKIPLEEVAKYRAFCRSTAQQRNFESFKEWLEDLWATFKNAKPKELGSLDRHLVLWQNEQEEDREQVYLGKEKSKVSVEIDGANAFPTQVDEEGRASIFMPVPDNTYYHMVNGELQPIDSIELKQTYRPGRGGRATRGGRGGSGFTRGGARALPPPSTPKDKKTSSSKSQDCLHCGSNQHAIFMCPVFEKLDLKAKYKIVREKKLCIRCLKPGHIARDCVVRFVCDVSGCGKRHHRFLHPYNASSSKRYLQMTREQGLESDLSSEPDEE